MQDHPAAPAGRILVGIVSFNRIGKLRRTLSECRRLGFDALLVVDNGSTDGSREFLREQQGLDLIFSETNEGGSGGFARLMRWFLERPQFSHLLLMDDDAYPAFTSEQLSATVSEPSHAHIEAFACKVVYPEGTLCDMNRPGVNVLARHPFWTIGKDFHVTPSCAESLIDFASFVGLILTRKAIQRVGVVSTQFFIYSDDTYYTLSISQSAGKILYSPRLVLIHDCKRSSRNLIHHDALRLQRDVINKIVMIREYAKFPRTFMALYVLRLIWMNPRFWNSILAAANSGIHQDLSLYRNQPAEAHCCLAPDSVDQPDTPGIAIRPIQIAGMLSRTRLK
jgi:GT2 family glycosyltransferase